MDEIEKHEKNLENNPNIYSYVPDEYLAQKGLKFMIIKNYLMFFTIDEENKIVNVM